MKSNRDNLKDLMSTLREDAFTSTENMLDILSAAYLVVSRDELPEVQEREYNLSTALAQSNFQPQLRFDTNEGDVPGDWNRNIAYANLAVAEAVDAKKAENKEAMRQEVEARQARERVSLANRHFAELEALAGGNSREHQ